MASLFALGALETLMVALVLCVSSIVGSFSRRYMDGDQRFAAFFRNLALLTVSVLFLVTANHVVLFVLSWLAMGHFLAKLIGHVQAWPAAKAAARIANWHFLASAVALIVAIVILVDHTGFWTLREILANIDQLSATQLWLVGGFVTLAGLIQSAIVPFHNWLMTSMNAPTPVSAFMHAGIVNAGGFLIVRFSNIYVALPDLLTIVFAAGALSALIASLWMMTQPDVKRSLGFSTVAQMGFMMVQCGLGLFTAAIVHLILHGFYKAFHFLGAGSSIENPKLPQPATSSLSAAGTFLMILGGVGGGFLFALLTGKSLTTLDGGSFLVIFAGFACAQAMNGFAQMHHWNMVKRAFLGLLLVSIAVGTYAALFMAVDTLIPINAAQPLNLVHAITLSVFFIGWLLLLSGRLKQSDQLYIRTLNTAQPPMSTIMHDRSSYVR